MEWCTDNKVSVNWKKKLNIVYGMRSYVKRSKSLSLGFILDEHLNFNKHVPEMCNLVSHKLNLLSKIRKSLAVQACITIFKSMVLSVIEYGDIIYTGTSSGNLDRIDRRFYRGLRICMGNDIMFSLCSECNISNLSKRRDLNLLLYMHKQSSNRDLLKPGLRNTRLHMAPVFWQYKPLNEKVHMNVLYRGALLWNNLPADKRNMEFKAFEVWLKTAMLE